MVFLSPPMGRDSLLSLKLEFQLLLLLLLQDFRPNSFATNFRISFTRVKLESMECILRILLILLLNTTTGMSFQPKILVNYGYFEP